MNRIAHEIVKKPKSWELIQALLPSGLCPEPIRSSQTGPGRFGPLFQQTLDPPLTIVNKRPIYR